MPVHNSDIADIIRKMADLLSIKGADEFRIRSYREAADSIEKRSDDLSDMVESDKDLTTIPDIGESMAEKIREIVKSGSLRQLDELREEVPEELTDMLNIEGLGPERVRDLYEELEIETLEQLAEAVKVNKVQELDGFGEKMEEKIARELERQRNQESRILLVRAEEIAEPLKEYLESSDDAESVKMAGSYRRRKETVGDLDILVTSADQTAIIDHFTRFEDVQEVIKKGNDRCSVLLKSNVRVDLVVFEEKIEGSALLYLTGSKAHTVKLRERAVDQEMKLNEYGLFSEDEDEAAASEKEEIIYDKLGLNYIEPELRENRGEIEAAEKGELPDLIEQNDLLGDIHMHSNHTDGDHSVVEMAEAAKKMGYEYIAITDHTERVNVAGGLNADEVKKLMNEIERADSEIDGIRILKGMEIDILKDGSLDLPDEILKELDIRICSVHYHLNLSEEKQTDRILKAMGNPHFQILGHPTGRQIEEREAMHLDMDKIMKRAKETHSCMEINANPHRLDLNDHYAKKAKDMGIKLTISTDAHSTGELKNMKYGVYQARRGWIEKEDVLNTMSANRLLKALNGDSS